jgi:hypothetical protein
VTVGEQDVGESSHEVALLGIVKGGDVVELVSLATGVLRAYPKNGQIVDKPFGYGYSERRMQGGKGIDGGVQMSGGRL